MIREYCLSKYRQIDIKDVFENANTSHLNPWELFIFNLEKELWKEFNEDIVVEINKKHPSTYRNGINKLNK